MSRRSKTKRAYDKAHNESSRKEYRLRYHPDELRDALWNEGWAYLGLVRPSLSTRAR